MPPDPGNRTARVRVRVHTRLGEAEIEVRVPANGCRADDLLPALRAIDDALVAEACRASAAAGRQVSCRPGCGACCRHLVAVTHAEARALTRLVEAMPGAQQRIVRSRFAAAVRILAEAGLRDELVQAPVLTSAARRGLAFQYFRLGIPCPFLEEESCSIYLHRPLVCREYVVSSPPELCRTLRHIERVSVPGRLFSRLVQQGDEGSAWVALVFAPGWVAEHPDAGDPGRGRSGPALITEILRADRTHSVR